MQANGSDAIQRTDVQDRIAKRGASAIVDAELIDDLERAIDALERVRWRDVDGVSPKTAAVFTRKLADARDREREGL